MSLVIVVLSGMLLGIPAMVLHECGHIAAALACGVRVKRIGLSWVGLHIVRDPGPTWANLGISLAGPLLNLLLAALLRNTLPLFAEVNLIAGLYNLAPIPHSDGSRILALLRERSTTPGSQQSETAAPVVDSRSA